MPHRMYKRVWEWPIRKSSFALLHEGRPDEKTVFLAPRRPPYTWYGIGVLIRFRSGKPKAYRRVRRATEYPDIASAIAVERARPIAHGDLIGVLQYLDSIYTRAELEGPILAIEFMKP